MLNIGGKIHIPDHEIEWSYARSSGSGGQNVNKVNSQVIIRWNIYSPSLPDDVRQRLIERYSSRLTTEGDLIIRSEKYRDQPRNAADCIEKLNELLKSVLYPPKKRVPTKPSRSSKRKRLDSKRKHSDLKKSRQGGHKKEYD